MDDVIEFMSKMLDHAKGGACAARAGEWWFDYDAASDRITVSRTLLIDLMGALTKEPPNDG